MENGKRKRIWSHTWLLSIYRLTKRLEMVYALWKRRGVWIQSAVHILHTLYTILQAILSMVVVIMPWGYGFGRGWGMGWQYGMPWQQYGQSYMPYQPYQPSVEQELYMIEQELNVIEANLANIKRRLEELKRNK